MFPSSMWLVYTSQRPQRMMLHRNSPRKFVISTQTSSQVRTNWTTVLLAGTSVFGETTFAVLYKQKTTKKSRGRKKKEDTRVMIGAITFKYF